MSYSSIVDALPESLRQPSKLALIASVAFHGVAFAALPYLPSLSKPINSQRVVDLVELSPAEQSRLPQSATSTAPSNVSPGLPPLGIGSLPPNLPNYVPGQPGSSTFNSTLPDFGRQPDLSSSIITVPIPQQSLPAQGSSPAPTIAPFPNVKDFEVPKTATNVPPFDPNKLSLPQVEADNAPVPAGLPPAPFPGNPGNTASATAPSPGGQPSPGSAPSPGNQPQAPVGPVERWLAQTRQVSPDSEIALQEKEVTLPYPQEACSSKMAGRAKVAALVDPQGKLVSLDGTVNGLKLIDSTGYPTLNVVALNPKNYAIAANGQYQRLVFSSEFEYSEQACAEQSQAPSEQPEEPEATPSTGSRSQLLATARQAYDSNISLRPATISYTYPSAACEDELSGLASVMSIVKPDGNLAESPRLTKSSGEQILDKVAIETVANHNFAGTGKYQAYISGFGFEYTQKACAGKSSPAAQSSQSPQSGAASEPTEKTTPSASPQPTTPTPPSPPATEETPASPPPATEDTPPAPESEPTSEPASEPREETPTPLPELPGEASPPSPQN